MPPVLDWPHCNVPNDTAMKTSPTTSNYHIIAMATKSLSLLVMFCVCVLSFVQPDQYPVRVQRETMMLDLMQHDNNHYATKVRIK